MLALAGLAAVAAGAAWLARERRRVPAKQISRTGIRVQRQDRHHTDADARKLRTASALLSTSVLLDSAVEHYRGSFQNPGMFTPLLASSLGIVANFAGRRMPDRVAYGVNFTAFAVGTAGLAFHLYNVQRKPGGFSWLNLFYAAPLGAPGALALAGLIGMAGTRISSDAASGPELLGLPAGRALAGLTGLGLAGTIGEVGLMHFRGSFQNPFMWLPVTLPPVAAALMLRAAVRPSRPGGSHRRTRTWLELTATLGIAGVGFHAYGVSRAMGGWRNWSQNLIDGPPLPAPPSFSALAIAGLAALDLIDREHG